MTDLLAARSQMAMSLAFHIIFAIIGTRIPVVVVPFLGFTVLYIIPPDLTLHAAAASPATLGLLVGALTLGSVLLLPSLWYLFRVFRREEKG